MGLVGKKINVKYNAGYEYIVNYKSNKKLVWKGVGGPIKGYSHEENCHIIEIRPNIFFVSWLEKNGTTVSQLLDFNKNKINSYLTLNTKKGRIEELRKGTIKIIK